MTADRAPLSGARVTLDGEAFIELRSGPDGVFRSDAPPGAYRLGVSAPGRAYVERALEIGPDCAEVQVDLGPEREPGRWENLGDPGERYGGTNSGVLMPDGRVIFCHDTRDAMIFQPGAAPGQRFVPARDSDQIQGCHAVSVLPDGRLLYVGGADRPVYGPGTRQVKIYDPVEDTWTSMRGANRLNEARWYPSLAPLPGGGFIATGGGGVDNPLRVASSEVLDVDTMRWRPVGRIAIGNEVSPVVLLFTGEVLMSHRPPQLYDPATERWRAAAQFAQGERQPDGDHADHELVMAADGRVVAIGRRVPDGGERGRMIEIYDPIRDRWSLGADLRPVRAQASALMLPTGRILIIGGEKQEPADPTPVNQWGQLRLTDLYDPVEDTARRLADLGVAREYHAMPILLPDGRVVVTGGEGRPGVEPRRSTVEVFSPPYLFRGPRPRIEDLAEASVERGEDLRFEVSRTNALSEVVLVGSHASTHFMDSGPGRILRLGFEQDGATIRAQVPDDPAMAIPGFYILFALVDGIPSRGEMVQVQR